MNKKEVIDTLMSIGIQASTWQERQESPEEVLKRIERVVDDVLMIESVPQLRLSDGRAA